MPMHLSKRETVFGRDIAQALTQLIGTSNLPLAFTRQQVVTELMVIAETDEQGIYHKLPRLFRKSTLENIYNAVTNSGVFQAGYKSYEEEMSRPCVPVTEYFFTRVYDVEDVTGCLEQINSYEIKNSLPKRTRYREVEDESNDDIIGSGTIAGVVVFPSNYGSPLLNAWLRRRINASGGITNSTVNKIERAQPSDRIKEVRAQLQPPFSGMRQALPRPKKKRD